MTLATMLMLMLQHSSLLIILVCSIQCSILLQAAVDGCFTNTGNAKKKVMLMTDGYYQPQFEPHIDAEVL